ncbi:MAG: hypothetical protein ACYCX9_02285 [Candidatus Dormibacteria bacterium]
MSGTSAALLLTACCLLGLAMFTLLHRRDAFGAVAALLVGASGVATGLVGFSTSAPTPVGAAQLQAYALVTEVLGVLCAGVGSALAMVLWRRSRSDLLEEPLARSGAGVDVPAPGSDRAELDAAGDEADSSAEPVSEESGADSEVDPAGEAD